MVHPLMFYDLERPAAGVYGNQDFGALLSFIRAQQAERPIVHYPEASWWLTFDLPVPLYLAPGHAGGAPARSGSAGAVPDRRDRRPQRGDGASPVHQRAGVGLLADRLLRGPDGVGSGDRPPRLPGGLHPATGARPGDRRRAGRGRGPPGAGPARSRTAALPGRQRRRDRGGGRAGNTRFTRCRPPPSEVLE